MRRPAVKESLVPILAVIAVSLAVYSNTLGHGLVWDDSDQILGNPWIRNPGFLPKIFSSGVWDFKSVASNYYRPMMHVIYMLAYSIFGLSPWGFHLINIIFNAGVSVLVFLIARAMFAEHGARAKAFPLPLMAAILFAVHPIHTEPVAWVAGIPDLSYALFCLLSFYLYYLSEDRFGPAYFLSVISYFLGTLCKEPAITLPALTLAYDLWLNERKPGLAFTLKRHAAFALAAAAYLAMRSHALGGLVPLKSFNEYGFYGNAFILTEEFLIKLVFPFGLKVIYMFSPAVTVLDPRVLLGMLLAAVVVALIYVAYRKDRLSLFCLLLIVVPLFPTLYVPATSGPSLLGERYLYLSSAGFTMLLASGGARLANSKGRVAGVSMLLAVAALFSLGTVLRNADWKDNYSLFVKEVEKSPESFEAHKYLGIGYMERGRYDLAVGEFLTTLQLNPFAEDGYKDLGISYGKMGKADESINALNEALVANSSDAEVYNYLGVEYLQKGELKKAEENFRAAKAAKSALP